MNDEDHRNSEDEPVGDQLPAKVRADVDRWRAAQPSVPEFKLPALPRSHPSRLSRAEEVAANFRADEPSCRLCLTP